MDSRDTIPTIPIYIMGKKYQVPMGLTIMKAMEYSGYHLTRGCGCRGGVCGACVTIYRKIDDYRWQIGLACQTVVDENIFLVQLPYVLANKATYDIRSVKLSEENVVSLYPELLRCMGCNTCSRSCPMGLEVMNYVSAAITGNWQMVTKLSMDCIMCGMCAARCPAELAPFNIALLIRRIVGRKAHQTPPYLAQRLDDIREGLYGAELDRLRAMSKEELLECYWEFQATKGKAV